MAGKGSRVLPSDCIMALSFLVGARQAALATRGGQGMHLTSYYRAGYILVEGMRNRFWKIW